jgi:uncharacterized protein involved in type VI secretion and phage assembly
MKGVVVALVVDAKDPDELGRVKLKFPWMPNQPETGWTRVAAPLAGSGYGMFFKPEIGDEALVGFEMDDPARPFVLGYMWSPGSKPPISDPEVRMIQTVSGHKLTFDDRAGAEKVEVEDKSGNKITLDSAGVTIESAADVVIKGQKVTITAGVSMELTTTGKLSASGNPIHLNP